MLGGSLGISEFTQGARCLASGVPRHWAELQFVRLSIQALLKVTPFDRKSHRTSASVEDDETNMCPRLIDFTMYDFLIDFGARNETLNS